MASRFCVFGLFSALPVVMALGTASAVSAEPLRLEGERLSFELPPGWVVADVHKDASASMYTIERTGEPKMAIEMIVATLEGADDAARLKGANKVLRGFMDIEKTLDFAPRGVAKLEMRGCTGKSYAYVDTNFESRLAVCSPSSPGDGDRLYAWHVMVENEDKDMRAAEIKVFHTILINHIEVLAGSAPPAGAAPPTPATAPELADPAPDLPSTP